MTWSNHLHSCSFPNTETNTSLGHAFLYFIFSSLIMFIIYLLSLTCMFFLIHSFKIVQGYNWMNEENFTNFLNPLTVVMIKNSPLIIYSYSQSQFQRPILTSHRSLKRILDKETVNIFFLLLAVQIVSPFVYYGIHVRYMVQAKIWMMQEKS